MNLRTPSALISGLALLALAAPTAVAETTAPTTATTTDVVTTTAPPTVVTTTAPPVTATATTTSPATETVTTTSAPPSTTTTTSAEAGAELVPGGTSRLFGPAAAEATIAEPSPAEAAAGYVARELAANGNHFVTWGSPDWGLTADGILALDAAGAGQTQAAASTADLAAHVRDYVTGEQWGDAGSLYAGAVAKTLNVALAQGVDPTAFGGVDLVATLTSLEQPSGQFMDVSGWGDYSNVFGQSFAVMGLERAGSGPSAAAVDFLTAQQCADGGFRIYFGAEPCSSDPDATAMAVQALIAVNGTSDADAVAGLDYLADLQAADGGVGGGGPQAAANANSTGLAGQAFVAGGRTAQARLAGEFLAALQYDCGFPAALRGGIAYDQAAYDAQVAKGSDATTADQDRRSTTQAILALAGTPLFAVTADGAIAGTPTVECATTTTTTTTTTTSSTTTNTTSSTSSTSGTTGTGTTSTTSSGPASTNASDDPSEPLAYTGASALPLGLLALVLLVVGAVLVLVSRRRGAHA